MPHDEELAPALSKEVVSNDKIPVMVNGFFSFLFGPDKKEISLSDYTIPQETSNYRCPIAHANTLFLSEKKTIFYSSSEGESEIPGIDLAECPNLADIKDVQSITLGISATQIDAKKFPPDLLELDLSKCENLTELNNLNHFNKLYSLKLPPELKVTPELTKDLVRLVRNGCEIEPPKTTYPKTSFFPGRNITLYKEWEKENSRPVYGNLHSLQPLVDRAEEIEKLCKNTQPITEILTSRMVEEYVKESISFRRGNICIHPIADFFKNNPEKLEEINRKLGEGSSAKDTQFDQLAGLVKTETNDANAKRVGHDGSEKQSGLPPVDPKKASFAERFKKGNLAESERNNPGR